jgi:hypothetical protein
MKRSLWIPLAAVLLASANARAQEEAIPEINFFGDDFPAGQPRIRMVNQANRPPPRTQPGDYQQTLLFQNGRQIRGELVAVSKEEVIWRRKDASEPLRFPRADVRRIFLVSPDRLTGIQAMTSDYPPSKKGPPQLATVKLPGGDWLRGAITSADGQVFGLTLAGGAPIQVSRAQIDWLSFGPKPAPAYGLGVGAMALEGWLTGGTPKVESKDGTLTIKDAQWIGRGLATPARFEVAFEVPADSEEGLRLWLQPFGPQPNSYSSGTVQVRFGRETLKWLVFHNNIQPTDLPLPAEAKAERGPVRYRVFYDNPGQHVVLWRNGRQLGDWSLKPKEERAGMDAQQRLPRALCFDREERGDKTVLQFRRLNVLPWDGVLPKANEAAPTEDQLSTPTPPARAGKLEEVREKELVFSGQAIPLAAETFIKFPQTPVPMEGAETMVSFGDQGDVSLAEFEMSEGKVRGRSVFQQAMALPASAVQLITFGSLAPATPRAGDLLVFKNGDELPGALVTAATDAPLRWRAASGQEVDFQTDRVAGIRLVSGARLPPSGTIELRSGERLRGALAALDERQLHWRHPVLGDLTMDRAQVWRLYPNSRPALKDGSQDPATWLSDASTLRRQYYYNRVRQRSEAWLPLDGRFILRAKENASGEQSLGPVCELGDGLDRFELRVDFVLLGDNPGTMNVNFLGANEGTVAMSLSSYEMSLYVQNPRSPAGGMSRELPFRDKIGENIRQFSLRAFVNGPAGTVDFCLNGYHLGRTGQTAGERLPGLGKGISIDTYTYSRTQMILSQVSITPWSGEIPKAGETGPLTVLANGDVATGIPALLPDGRWRLESEIGPLELPVGKVQAVEFGGEMQPATAAARVRMVDGSALLVDRFQWAGGELTAHHAVFGDLRIPAASVGELIYDPSPVRPPTMVDPKKIARKDNTPVQPLR